MNKYFSIIAVVISTSLLVPTVSFADTWYKESKSVSAPTKSATQPRRSAAQPPKKSNGQNNSQSQSQSQQQSPAVGSKIDQNCIDSGHCDGSAVFPGSPAANQQAGNNSNSSIREPTRSVADALKCRNEIAEMVNGCTKKVESASSDCNAETDDGITSATNGLSQMVAGMGVQSACTAIGKAMGAANAAVATFSQMCDSERRTCISSCSAVRVRLDNDKVACFGNVYDNEREALYDRVRSNVSTCNNLDAKVQQGVAAVNNTMGTITGAQNCATQVDTTLLYCKQNPTAAGCNATASDCSNPAIAASNPICICRNSADPSCSQANSRAADGSMGNSDMSSSGLIGGAGANGAGGAAGGLDDVSWQGRDWKPGNSSGEDPGGDKGGRPIQDGSAGGGGGPEGGGGPGERTAVNVNSGLRGGGGSGGGSGGFFASEEGGGRGGSAAGGNQALGNPDLRNFLPGGKYDPKTRGIAGISGPDGITGPHSNIWQKINNRYQAEKPKLIP